MYHMAFLKEPVLGPLLFILYIADAATILEKPWTIFSLYADDVQLYLSGRRLHTHTAVCASRVCACIDDITKWMASNRLMVNPAKTDVLWCSTSQPPPDTPLLPAGTVWLGGRVVRTLDLRSIGREFESWPLRYRVQPLASC